MNTLRSRIPLNDIVEQDPWWYTRAVGFAAFAIGYVAWFVERGLIVDRISVAISVGIFTVIGHLGRPARRWAWLLADILCYCAMWFCYEESRGWADKAGFELQVHAMRNIDRFLFFGHDPTVVLQNHFYDSKHVHWYDTVASLTYFTHFIVPVIAIAVVWVTSRREWVRFIKRFASVLVVACALYVILPTSPPWLVSRDQHLLLRTLPDGQRALLARSTSRGFIDLGLRGFATSWQRALDWSNPIAAMPSLHASLALFVPAFFLPRIRPRWLKALVLCFPVMMMTALVYFAEHWVIDGIVGWVLVGSSFLVWGWIERRQLRIRAARARAYLAL